VWVSIGGLELFVAAFLLMVALLRHFLQCSYYDTSTGILLCLCWLLLPGRVMLILDGALSRDRPAKT